MRALTALIVSAFGVVALLVGWKKVSEEFRHRTVHEASMNGPTVKVRFRVIDYSEAEDRSLELGWEPRVVGPPPRQPIGYVPSEKAWENLMPDWAQGRRDEIMRTIKTETAYMNFEWQEFDQS